MATSFNSWPSIGNMDMSFSFKLTAFLLFLVSSNSRILFRRVPILAIVHVKHLASNLIYSLYFHPLYSFPGPKLWAISRLPFVLKMRSGDLVHTIQGIHEKYGYAAHLALNEVSFIDPAACPDIYGNRSGYLPFPKIGSGCRPTAPTGLLPSLMLMTPTTLGSAAHGRMAFWIRPWKIRNL